MKKLRVLFYMLYFYFVFLCVKVLTLWFYVFKPRKHKNEIVFLELFGPPMAGYTARSKYWSDLLSHKGFTSYVLSLTTYDYYKQCMQQPDGLLFFQRTSLWKRIKQCWQTRHATILIVRREVLMYNDYGSLFMEKWLRAMHTTLVIDFDDDIAAAKRESNKTHSLFAIVMAESKQKFTASLAYYDAFIFGTPYLKQRFAPVIHAPAHLQLVLPTCVPFFEKPLKHYQPSDAIKIGWVGSSYNLKNIESIFTCLEKVYEKVAFEFILICDTPTTMKTQFPIHYIKWTQQNEYEHIAQMDIGLMPLMPGEVSAGKSAFKLLQYMSVGVVPVASAITINNDIINQGVNGFLVYAEDTWQDVLLHVINQKEQFAQIGDAAFQLALKHYSFTANESHFLNFIHKLTER